MHSQRSQPRKAGFLCLYFPLTAVRVNPARILASIIARVISISGCSASYSLRNSSSFISSLVNSCRSLISASPLSFAHHALHLPDLYLFWLNRKADPFSDQLFCKNLMFMLLSFSASSPALLRQMLSEWFRGDRSGWFRGRRCLEGRRRGCYEPLSSNVLLPDPTLQCLAP